VSLYIRSKHTVDIYLVTGATRDAEKESNG